MPQPTCRHVHANGALCQSPPLRHRDYCHFHLDQIGRQLRAARARALRQPARLKLPLLEDPFAVQVALMQVADAITHDELDVQRGRLLMSVLRLASRNLKTMRDWKQDPLFVAHTCAETAVTEWPSFEQENQLPTDFDLGLDPEAAFPLSQQNSAGSPYISEVAMYGNYGLPLGSTTGLNGTPANGASDSALRARIRQALDGAAESVPRVTADQVELLDIYQRDGNEAGKKFANQMVRNDLRRERRLRRAHYEEVARNHSIQLAAKRLIEDQQREALAKAQSAVDDASFIGEVAKAGHGIRKTPGSATAARASQAGSGSA